MKCIQCAHEWKWTADTANMDFCPHCGAKLLELLLNKSKEMTPNEILQYLMQIFGVALLENQPALEGVLSDCFSHDKELKALLLLSVRHQLHIGIYSMISHPHRRQELNRLRSTFAKNASCGLDKTNELIYHWKKVLHWSDYKALEDNSQLTVQDFRVALRWVWIRTKRAGRYLKRKSFDWLMCRVSDALTMGMAVPCKYDAVGDFSEGLARVAIDGRWGFVDDSGNECISLVFDAVGDFNNGMAKVKLNGKWGFVNKKGEVKVGCVYDFVYDFKDGFAQVRILHEYDGPCVNRGFVNKRGVFFAPFNPRDCSKNSKEIWQQKLKYFLHRVPRRNLEYYVTPDPTEGTNFIEGWKWISNGVNFGFINQDRQKNIPLQFDAVWDFNNGLALVKLKDKFGFINKQGKRVIPIQYDGGGVRFNDGLVTVRLNGKWGFIDKNNKVIIAIEYSNVMKFCQGLAGVCIDGQWGFIDKNKKTVISCVYDECKYFNAGLASVKLNGKWGFVCIPLKQDLWSILKKIVLYPNCQVMSRLEEMQAAELKKVHNEINEKVHLTFQKMIKQGEECLQNIKQDKLDALEKASKPELRYVRLVNQDACIAFLQKYGKTELVESMRRFVRSPGKTMEDKYQHWLDAGAGSASTGGFVDKGIEFEALSQMEGGSLDLFQFLYDIEMGAL